MNVPKSLFEAVARFSDESAAFRYLRDMRWPNGVACPYCGVLDPHFIETRRIWRCNPCSRQFSVKVGSIMEDSPISCGKWVVALWSVANAKNGVSSCELARALGITQKSAWHMIHRIRLAMEVRTFRKLSGVVEVDETYVGGKRDVRRKSHSWDRRGTGTKTPVFGLLERGGEVRAYSLPNVKGDTLQAEIEANVWAGTELYTDNNQSYVRMKREYIHKSVNHMDIWAVGTIHTNNIENFWGLFKRCIKGTWVRPSPKHMDRYAADQVFRYNYRKEDDRGRFLAVSAQMFGRRLTWRELVGER